MFTTMITVCYGDRYPVTGVGRLVAFGLMMSPRWADAGEHTDRLAGLGSRNATQRLVGSGPAARPVTSYQWPLQSSGLGTRVS
jgi:hypothetical protein